MADLIEERAEQQAELYQIPRILSTAEMLDDPAIEVTVSHIMTKDVCTVNWEKPAIEAINLFIERDLSGLPVIDTNNKLVGFITELDVLESWVKNRRIAEIMTRDIIYVYEDSKIKDIVNLILEARVKQIPVVNRSHNSVVGIITRKDILRHLFWKDEMEQHLFTTEKLRN